MNREPLRKRKLLLHKREILKLSVLTSQKGFTLIPLNIYLKNGRVKMEIGTARGKHNYDKRQDLKLRTEKLDMAKAMKR